MKSERSNLQLELSKFNHELFTSNTLIKQEKDKVNNHLKSWL